MLMQTSLQAWKEIQSDLTRRQFEVYNVFKAAKRPLTNAEVAEILGRGINTITPRTQELRGESKTQSNIYPPLLQRYEKRPCNCHKCRAGITHHLPSYSQVLT